MEESISIAVEGPYDLALTLAVGSSFSPVKTGPSRVFRSAVRAAGAPVVVEVSQPFPGEPVLSLSSPSAGPLEELASPVSRMLFADLDLKPFYEMSKVHGVFEQIVRSLYGLKPIRPASLFEMAVYAVTEQQISLAAAYTIRRRIIDAFGDAVLDLTAFPSPERIEQARVEELAACGLSGRKAEYIHLLAERVSKGGLNLSILESMDDNEALSFLTGLKGFGKWSAEYILVRGLGRMDIVPADDLGIRDVVGKYLYEGRRVSPDEVRSALMPFEPYRGLAAFYLLAFSRAGIGPKP